jgi:Rap1a immunity proteins
MKLLRLLTICILSIVPETLIALTGNELYTLCSTGNRSREDLCVGYVMDVMDTFPESIACPPEGVTLTQVREVVATFLRDHPEKRQERATDLVAAAVQAAFPCRQ